MVCKKHLVPELTQLPILVSVFICMLNYYRKIFKQLYPLFPCNCKIYCHAKYYYKTRFS